MKRILLLAGAATAGLALLTACEKGESSSSQSKQMVTSGDSISYVIGTDIGQSLMSIKDEIKLEQLMQGISDKLDSASLKIDAEQSKAIMQQFNGRMRDKQMAEAKLLGEKNLSEGKKFLEENKSKPGVKTTASGLQYIVVTEGKGPKPKVTDKVKTHYKGTLLDGTEFDNSYTRGQPLELEVNRVIKGWSEALQLMSPGSKFKLFIPSELGYGERGAGKQIGPNSVLVFDVELIEIVK